MLIGEKANHGKRRRQRDHRSYRDRESSSLSGNEKGHRWSSSSTAESETESDELSSSKTYKRTCKHLSSLHPSKNLQMMNLSDVVEAVTASSEESDDEEVGTSDIIHRPTVHKLSGDSPLPCVIQSNPPAENLRPSFERRLENLFRSSSMQPSTIETHEKERLNDAVNISVPSWRESILTDLLSTFNIHMKEMKKCIRKLWYKSGPLPLVKLPEHLFVERNSAEATVGKCPSHLNSTESWANSQLVANSIRHDAISDPIGVSSLVNAINEDKEENKHLDKIMEEHELIKDQEIKIGCELKEKEERKELEEQILEKKKAARENYVHAVYVAVREDLKNVLLKDLMRKIESVAFEKLEQGWKERNKAKIVEQDDDSWQNDIKDSATDIPMLTIDKPCIPLVEQTVSSKDSLNEMVRRVTEQTKAEMSAAFGPDTVALLGTGLFFKGLGIARNMPSFKKKQAHSSPRRKQRSRSSSCRSFCSAYSRTRSDRTPESNRSYERSESQHRSESSLPGRRSSDDEEAKSENERSTNGSESTCSTDRSSRTLSIRKHFSSGTFTQTDGSTSEEDEDEEEEVDEEEEEQEHVEKDFDELCAANKLSACSEFEEKPVLFVKTKTGACGGIESLSNRTATSYLIEHDKITEELRARNNKVLGIANIEGYFNDHCYLPVELSEQLKKNLKKTKNKKRCYRNELASLLPPPVNVEQLTWESSWKSTKQWEKRTHKEEKEIFWKFEKEGLDAEDLMFLEKAFHEMQNDGTATWNRKLYWIPPRKVPIVHLLDKPKKIGKNIYYYDDLELEGVVPHSSGCARTEGYYKLSHKEKRGVLRRPDVFLTEISEKDTVASKDSVMRDDEKARYLMQSTREARSMNRRLLTSMGDTSSDIFKVNQLKILFSMTQLGTATYVDLKNYDNDNCMLRRLNNSSSKDLLRYIDDFRKKLIKFARSRIHGWGLYALEAIAPDEMIVEYIGQKYGQQWRMNARNVMKDVAWVQAIYSVIDATQMGNLARFINHSCQPNCYAKIVVVDGEKRIVIYSKLPISKGDEITYDYKFPIEEDKIDCLCGAPGCRGSLN
ncbi:putative histone-lysine N-methyltransferase set-2 [Dirofilaria immitis]|nr:putative histone-lysine N-methyltransferase set-2 [Dirofilaria immitis]